MRILAISLGLAVSASAASAQIIEGGAVSLNSYSWNSDCCDYVSQFGNASAVTHIGPVGIQLDGSIFKYSDDEEIIASFGVHAFIDISSSIRVVPSVSLKNGRSMRTLIIVFSA